MAYKYRDTQAISIEPVTETGSIVTFENPDDVIGITSLIADIEPKQDGTPSRQTVTDDIVTFDNTDGAAHIYDLTAEINPIQDLHGYSKPWAGGNGKNLLNYDAWKTVGVTNGTAVWENNGLTLTATSNDCYTLYNSADFPSNAKVPVSEGDVVTLSWESQETTYRGAVYIFPNGSSSGSVAKNNTIGSVEYTVPSGVTFITIRFGVATSGNTCHYKNIMIRKSGDATFEPYSNICPISGWDEAVIAHSNENLAVDDGHNWYVSSAGVITEGSNADPYDSVIVKVESGQQYHVEMSGTDTLTYAFFTNYPSLGSISYNKSREVLVSANAFNATAPINGFIFIRPNNTSVGVQKHVVSVTKGSTATTDTADGNAFIIDLDGTRYGAHIDVTRGVMVLTHKLINLGDYTWTYVPSGLRFYTALPEHGVLDGDAIGSQYIKLPWSTVISDATKNGAFAFSSDYITVRDLRYTDGTTFKSAMTLESATVVYELATPLTVQLTPTQIEALLGEENNVWASTGDITLDYGYIYPIQGYSEINIYVSPTEDAEDATVYPVDLNGTRYGKQMNVTTGQLQVCPYYASYNGETLTGEWISDRDVYAPGTAPSIGAQVVNIGGTLTTEQLLPTDIKTLVGTNNVRSDSGDITLTYAVDPSLYITLPKEAVSMDGRYLERMIDGYTTLYVKGRESLGIELNNYSVGTADGEKIKGSRYPSRTLTIGFQLLCEDEVEFRAKFNQLNNILSIDEADFIFADEPTMFFTGTPIMDASIEPGRNNVVGEWKLYCAYPFKRSVAPIVHASTDADVVKAGNTATFTFDYAGTRPARPLLRATFASAKSGGDYNEDGDCGYIAFLDSEENIVQLGNPDVIDVDALNKNGTLINSEFDNLTNWTANGISVGSIVDAFWNNGQGQTQNYATGVGTLTRAVTGAIGFEFDIVHRLCVSAPAQTGTFKVSLKNGNNVVVGFIIEKTGSGTLGTVKYILNNKVVGTDSIDLSFYNTNFGYCRRDPVYVTQYYSEKEYYYVKKKGKKKKKKSRWVTRTRTVQSGWSYTQSNLNSGISRDGGIVTFSVGNLSDRTFKDSDIDNTSCTSVVFETTGTFHTNAVRSCAWVRKAGVPFAEIPNVFTAGDIVEGDCNTANVLLYRAGSAEGHLEPQYGALGNDWEDFTIKPGQNIIRAVWSDWVNENYKPKVEIIFNEVFI